MQSVIRKQLTKYLSKWDLQLPEEASLTHNPDKVTEPLSKETTFAVRRIFGDSPGMCRHEEFAQTGLGAVLTLYRMA